MTKFAFSVVRATIAAVALGMFAVVATAQPAGGGGGGNAAPQIVNFASSNNYALQTETIRFSWQASDADGDALTCTFDPTGVGPETVISNCAGPHHVDHQYPASSYFHPRLTVSDGTSSVHMDLQQFIHGTPMYIGLGSPSPHQTRNVVGDMMPVGITLLSERDVVSVTARVATVQQPLNLVPCEGGLACLSATMDLSGLASGPYTVEIVAEDIDGVRSYAYRRIVLDRPPQLVVTAPIAYTVGRPFVRVTADCIDDIGGCTIEGAFEVGEQLSPVLPPTPAPIDADVDLTVEFESGLRTFRFTARDASGQTSIVKVPLHIDLSPQLVEVDSVDGPIVAVSGRRILYVLVEEQGDRLFAFDRDVRVPIEIPLPAGRRVDRATTQWSTTGAIVVARPVSTGPTGLHRIYEWNGSTLTDLGNVFPSEQSIAVAGDYAIWTYQRVLSRRDIATGTTVLVVPSGVPPAGAALDNRSVTADGIVTYAPRNRTALRRFDGSATTTIATATGTLQFVNPSSDGTTTLVLGEQPDGRSIVMFDAGGEHVLRPLGPGDASQYTYDVRNGWYAYTLPSSLGAPQVWAAPVGGTPVRRTFGGTTPYAVTRIGMDGKILVSNRWMSTPDGELLDLGGGTIQHLQRDGWEASIGRSLYSIQGTAGLFEDGFEPEP